MIKKTKIHSIYEIWNEYLAESVFVDHKPTKKEMMEVCYQESWISRDEIPPQNMMGKFHIYKLDRLYTRT
jgi:hypothetical protein